MDVQHMQSRIAEIRRLLAEITSLFSASKAGAGPAGVPPAQSDPASTAMLNLVMELRAFCNRFDSGTSADHELLSTTLGSIGDAVITLDTAGAVVLLNTAAEQLTGWPIRDAAGKPVEEIIAAFDEKKYDMKFPGFLERCLAETDAKMEKRCMLRSRDGKERIVSFHGTRMTENGRYLGAVLVLHDITQRYFLEEEILKIRKLESVGVLAGGIAHDFNNLLTGITTNLFMARMSVTGNAEANTLISEAEKAAFKATSLTKQLLSFAKGGPSIKEKASIKQLIQDTVGFCLSGSNVDYRLDLPDDLLPVDVDKGQIDQALNNLIANAAQSMPDGGTVAICAENYLHEAAKSASVSARAIPLPNGDYVRVSIRDEGVGIPHENLEHIFDPYFTTKKEGSGLGLTTSYSIIKKHGGHIYVESEQGKGSAFTFFLPAVKPDEGPGKKSSDALLHRGEGRVLIMDDDMIVRTVVETLLKKAGYTPVCVANGEQALAVYADSLSRGSPFIITIMDLTIPGGMGGRETVKRLRQIDPGAKVIVFSGYYNDPIFANYREFGFDGVLSKPFSIDEFMKTIASMLKPGSAS